MTESRWIRQFSFTEREVPDEIFFDDDSRAGAGARHQVMENTSGDLDG